MSRWRWALGYRAGALDRGVSEQRFCRPSFVSTRPRAFDLRSAHTRVIINGERDMDIRIANIPSGFNPTKYKSAPERVGEEEGRRTSPSPSRALDDGRGNVGADESDDDEEERYKTWDETPPFEGSYVSDDDLGQGLKAAVGGLWNGARRALRWRRATYVYPPTKGENPSVRM